MEMPNSKEAAEFPGEVTIKQEIPDNDEGIMATRDEEHSINAEENVVLGKTKTRQTRKRDVLRTRSSTRLQSKHSTKPSKSGNSLQEIPHTNKNRKSTGRKARKSFKSEEKLATGEINDDHKLPEGKEEGKEKSKLDSLKTLSSKKQAKASKLKRGARFNDSKGKGNENDGDEDWSPSKSSRKQSKHGKQKNKSSVQKDQVFQCTTCEKILPSATKLKMHQRQHNSFSCKYCGIQYRTQHGLSSHEKRHIDGSSKLRKPHKPYKCKHCGVQWVSSHYYEKHEKRCLGPHTCDYCNTEVANLRLLYLHKRRTCPKVKAKKPKKAVCSYCGKLVERCRMNDHNIIHTGDTPYVCDVCAKPFRTKRTLQYHMYLHKKIGNVELSEAYKCKHCNKACKSQLYLDFHEKRHLGQNPYPCTECPKSFFYLNQFYEHQRSHQGKSSLQCKICKKSYRNERCLKRHVKTHTREDAVQCPECLKMFSTAGNLKLHQRLHTKEVQFPCKHCDRVFVQKSHLQYHEQSHTERVMYKCPECKKEFTTSYYRDLHLRVTHTKQDLANCPHCNKMFQNQSRLKRHILSVCAPDTVEENIFCRHCGDTMKNTLHLEEHLRKKHNEHNFTCKICKYVASKSSSLKTHMRRHTGERPYKCEHCDRAFKQRTTLKNHEKLHTGEKPYKCHICSMAFIQKYNLTCHIRIHTGDRPWICKYCARGFTQQTSYKSHESKCGQGLLRPHKTPSRKPAKQKQVVALLHKEVEASHDEADTKEPMAMVQENDTVVVPVVPDAAAEEIVRIELAHVVKNEGEEGQRGGHEDEQNDEPKDGQADCQEDGQDKQQLLQPQQEEQEQQQVILCKSSGQEVVPNIGGATASEMLTAIALLKDHVALH